jgi:DNA invertase Pin-like site-specific DNA recombinase
MDRLARNLDDLRRLVRTLTGKGVRVQFVKENLVFTGNDSPMATLLPSVMRAFAEFERALIRERQREGIAAAGCSDIDQPQPSWASTDRSETAVHHAITTVRRMGNPPE